MKISDYKTNFGKEVGFQDIFSKLKRGKSVLVFCSNRQILKQRMDALERFMGGEVLANYAYNQLTYKSGSASFYIVPELLLSPKTMSSLKADYYCNWFGCIED